MKNVLLILVCGSLVIAHGRDFAVRDYGAVGDGQTKDTAAIQRAIDACALYGGGRVVLEHGVFLSGTIALKSGVELHLDVSARMLGSSETADYIECEWRHLRPKSLPRGRGTALIIADQAENVAITGRGTIDGNGMAFVKKRENPTEFTEKWCPYERDPEHLGPPRLMLFAGCRNLLFTDFTTVNVPSGWTFYLNDCDIVHIDRVNVLSGLFAPNIDGIHLNCCRDVMVSNCRIETQDDSIVVRADDHMLRQKGKTCERILVSNCSLRSHCNAIRMSYYNDQIVRSCVFSNLTIADSRTGIHLELKPKWKMFDKKTGLPTIGEDGQPSLRPGVPSVLEDISFSTIDMQRVESPLLVRIGNRPWTVCRTRGIRFTDVRARDGKNLQIFGGEGNPLEDFSFVNCSLRTEKPVELKRCLNFKFDPGTFSLEEDK